MKMRDVWLKPNGIITRQPTAEAEGNSKLIKFKDDGIELPMASAMGLSRKINWL
ncbi:MAG: hypothetical protein RBR35_12505 [Salinivirgaceae bacterium]|nr:hypothetical protein [Salinivirgaceae bacterium]